MTDTEEYVKCLNRQCEWEGPEGDLLHYVSSGQIICPECHCDYLVTVDRCDNG